jgi:hypothetical protein
MRPAPIDTQALAPPPLAWRRPVWLWALIALALSVAWPALFLRTEGGLAQFAAITVGAAFLLALAALAIAYRIGRPPKLRRHVIAYMVAAAAFCALVSPFAFLAILGALASSEHGGDVSGLEIAGLTPDMAWALAPLALAVGAPTAVVAGLALALLGFHKRPPAPPAPQPALRAIAEREADG